MYSFLVLVIFWELTFFKGMSFFIYQDLTDKLLPLVLPSVFTGLRDPDDDVRAVAAAALVPVTDSFVKLMPQQVSTSRIAIPHYRGSRNDKTATH